MIKLFHEFVKETKCMTPKLEKEIIECCETVVKLEDNFIDLAFSLGPVEGNGCTRYKKLHKIHCRLET